MSKPKVRSTVYPESPAPDFGSWCQWMIANYKRDWIKRFKNFGVMEVIYVEYEGEELGEYSLDVDIEATVRAVDHGIGEYEFWGTKGYHTDIRPEIDDINILNVKVYDEDSNEVEITKSIETLVEKWIANNSSKVEEDILAKAKIDC